MKWNNGKERAKFEREQKELREQYIAEGMTEEQIQAMYDFDLDVFNGKRREAEHTQTLDFAAVEAEDKELENPLYNKFSDKLSVTMNFADASRYAWIDEIEDERLVKAIKALPQDYIEILTEIIVDRRTKSDIANERGVLKTAISNKICRIKNIFKKFL